MSDISERIAAARREAEQLKERIKAQREAVADTTRKPLISVCTKRIYMAPLLNQLPPT